MRDVSAVNKAFNLGADARLAGQPLSVNPYPTGTYSEARDSWKRGWREADGYWGANVASRWRVRELPPVQGKVSRLV